MQKAAVGFDLGTTISVASYVDESGQPQVVHGRHGSPLIPSAILFSDDAIVGHDAVVLSEQALDNFAEGFKRDIGKPHYRKRVRLCQVPPEILTAFLVEHLAANTRQQIGELTEIVVTVPAYFDERQRTSTQRAVALAGLNVLDVINEPTAAAIAAGFDLLQAGRSESVQRLLVYDLGGGTFDATLLEIEGKVFKTLGTDGDIYLGGRDFNERIVNVLVESFLSKHGVDPRSDPTDLLKLQRLANETKHALSDSESFDVSFQHAGLVDGFTFTRDMFEDAVAQLIERTLMTSQAVVTDAGLTWNDIDQILLVGGSSRIPLVRQRLAEESGKAVRLAERPDELVARGAALYAALRSDHDYLDAASRFEVVNVNAHSLGIQGVDLQTKQRINQIIIPRNTPLPTASTQIFHTMEDGQKNVRVRLLEGESENPVFCSSLGQCVVHLGDGLPGGTEVRVRCSYDASGTISVSAHVPATKVSASVELRREGFAEMETLDVWRSRLSTNASPADRDADATLPPAPASLGADSNVNELLARLDQLHAHVGRHVGEAAVPASAVPLQRLYQQTRREAAALKHLIDLLNKQQHAQQVPFEKMQLQGHLARTRMAWDQVNKLNLHSGISLGREYLRRHQYSGTDAAKLSDEISNLTAWLSERTAM